LTFTAGAILEQCGGTSTQQFTFVASDDCGNSVTTFANLIMVDETAPILTLPTATNIFECDAASGLSAWIASASATDECGGDVTITTALISEVESCDGDMHTNITSTYRLYHRRYYCTSDHCTSELNFSLW